MSTETETQTVSDLKLTPPDPVPVVAPTQAMGLVPVTDDQKSKLEERVEAYIADLIAQDVNSPEFGKRVDQLTNMGPQGNYGGGWPIEPFPRQANPANGRRFGRRR